MSGGSLLKSLETLNFAKITAEGTLKSRHLGSVLGLVGFQDISPSADDDEAARRIMRSVSVLDVGIYDGNPEVGGASGKENAVEDRVNVKKRFLYRRQRGKIEIKKPKPSPKKSPSKGSVLSAKPFSFDTPSPDDIVSEKQKMAFEHSSETKVLSKALAGPEANPVVADTTSVDDEKVKALEPPKAAEKLASPPISSSDPGKKNPRKIQKEASPNVEDDDSGPDDWESHYFGS